MHEMNERENLRERASYYVLARFIPGEVFHVDSVVNEGKVMFAGTNQYGRPPMQVAHQGGAYISRTLERGSADEKTLLAINKKLVPALGLQRGATHAEFIKSDADGKFYFLEIAARVGASEHELDNWLWSRGQAPEYKTRPRHRTRTVYY